MEVGGEQTRLLSSSIEALLDQLEVSGGPDLHSLEIITASEDDLLLGGEVEVRDVSEPARSQKNEGEAGENVTNYPLQGLVMLVQGGAQYEELVEEAIGMEVEVTPKSSCSSQPATPRGTHDELMMGGVGLGGEWGGVSTDEVVEVGTSEIGVCEEKKNVGRRRDVYVPPVTEWRDFQDSQDILLALTSRCEESGERQGERESIGDNGQQQETDETVEGGGEGGGDFLEDQGTEDTAEKEREGERYFIEKQETAKANEEEEVLVVDTETETEDHAGEVEPVVISQQETENSEEQVVVDVERLQEMENSEEREQEREQTVGDEEPVVVDTERETEETVEEDREVVVDVEREGEGEKSMEREEESTMEAEGEEDRAETVEEDMEDGTVEQDHTEGQGEVEPNGVPGQHACACRPVTTVCVCVCVCRRVEGCYDWRM